jgi:tetratricopeptide (TPR) repeat protein
VRRVMVHSDVCQACRAFLQGIRAQSRAHQALTPVLAAARAEATDDLASIADAPSASPRARELCRQLLDNRKQLAKILYELGRGFVVMGVSPNFSRVVAREPVPIPDVCLRGRHLIDEAQRLAGGIAQGLQAHGIDGPWVRARDLFEHGQLGTPEENLEKGRRLLRECLALRPDYHEARIFLGHSYHVASEREAARLEFGIVLQRAEDPETRAYALLHLGNVYLEEGLIAHSIPYFQELVDARADSRDVLYYAASMNLVFAFGLLGQFHDCKEWLRRVDRNFPHKRRAIAAEMRKRPVFCSTIDRHPAMAAELAAEFPHWFPIQTQAGAI